jgi:hypothetical protein
MLLEEIIKFDKDKNTDKVKNFDRIVAAELAIALANKLNPVIKVNSLDVDNRIEAYYRKVRGEKGQKRSKSVLSMKMTEKKSPFRIKRRSRLFL